jgi:hypothetical protein
VSAEEIHKMSFGDKKVVAALIEPALVTSKQRILDLGADRIPHIGDWKKRLLDKFADWVSGRAQMQLAAIVEERRKKSENKKSRQSSS